MFCFGTSFDAQANKKAQTKASNPIRASNIFLSLVVVQKDAALNAFSASETSYP
jgi:hypothetical protein